MSSGAAEQEQGARRAKESRLDAISSAMNQIRTGYGSAKEELTPYKRLGTDAMSYFDQFKTPGGISSLYEKYGATTDPLNAYYQRKNEEAVNRQMAARGKYGSGTAIEAQTEASAALQAKMAGLTEQRVQSELGLQERQLQRGIGIGQNLADLYSTEGRLLSDLEQSWGAAEAGMHEQIGAARRAGKQYETGLMTTALGVLGGGVLGGITGGLSGVLSGAQTGANIGSALSGGGQQTQQQQIQPQQYTTSYLPTEPKIISSNSFSNPSTPYGLNSLYLGM